MNGKEEKIGLKLNLSHRANEVGFINIGDTSIHSQPGISTTMQGSSSVGYDTPQNTASIINV